MISKSRVATVMVVVMVMMLMAMDGGSQGGNEKKVWNGMRLGGFMMVLWRGNGLDCCRARSVHCTSSIMADGLFLSRALTVGEDVGAPSPVQLSASKVLGPRKGCTDHKPP